MHRALNVLIVLIVLGAVCWLFPPFRIVPLKQARVAKQQAAFKAAEYAGAFWTNRLLNSLDAAADTATVLGALSQDPKTAAQRHGRNLGLGSSTFYFLRGNGTVVSVEKQGVGVSLRGPGAPADVLLQTGLLFGNALRDGTGLLDVNQFPNSQDFNAIAAELNRIAETQVIPAVKTNAAVGRSLRFVACAEVVEDDAEALPLKLAPVFVEFP